MYSTGVDATGPAYLGEAQAARLAELLKSTGLHQGTSPRDPGDLVDAVCWHGLPPVSSPRYLCLCKEYSRSSARPRMFLVHTMRFCCINIAANAKRG
jgi:hypothetical protein